MIKRQHQSFVSAVKFQLYPKGYTDYQILIAQRGATKPSRASIVRQDLPPQHLYQAGDSTGLLLPMVESDEVHLSQRVLTEDGIYDILETLSIFLADAPFEQDKKGLEYCSDERLKDAARPVFPALGTLIQDKINSKHMQCNVLRLRPGTTPLTSRSADLIPVKIWGDNPTIDGIELATGSVTHITKGVKIQIGEGSVLDLLFLVERKEKENKKYDT